MFSDKPVTSIKDALFMKLCGRFPVSLLHARTGNLVDIIYVSGADLVSDVTFGILASYGNRIGAVRMRLMLDGHRLSDKDTLSNAGVVEWSELTIDFEAPYKLLLCISGDSEVEVWDLGGNLEHTLRGHTDEVSSAEFSPDDSLIVTAGCDGTAKLWSAASGLCILTFVGHGDSVNTAVFNHDGTAVLTGSSDGTAKHWSVDSARCIRTLTHVPACKDCVMAALSPRDDGIALTATKKGLILWDLGSGTPIWHQLHSGTHVSRKLDNFSPRGKWLLSISPHLGHDVHVWDVGRTCLHHRRLDGHTAPVSEASFSMDGSQVLTASNDHTAKVWSLSPDRKVRTFQHDSAVFGAAFCPKGLQIVTLSGHSAWLWDICNQSCLRRLFLPHTSLDAAFTPDGEFVWTGHDSSQALWDSASGRQWYWLGLADQTYFAFSRHRGDCKGGERNQHSILCKPKSRKTEACIQAGDMEPAQVCHRMDSQSTTGHVETTWPEGSSTGPTGGCRPAQDMVGHSTGTCVHKITIIFSPAAEGRPANEDERSPRRPNKRRQSDCGLSRPDPETVPSRRA